MHNNSTQKQTEPAQFRILDREPGIRILILHNEESSAELLIIKLLNFSGGADVRVDVIDPSGRRRNANVEDTTHDDGRYKALYLGSTKGKHRATVYLYGTPMTNDYVFRVVTPSPIERLNLSKYTCHSDAHAKVTISLIGARQKTASCIICII